MEAVNSCAKTLNSKSAHSKLLRTTKKLLRKTSGRLCKDTFQHLKKTKREF